MVPSNEKITRQISRLWLAIWLMPIAICTLLLLWRVSGLRPEVVEAQSFRLIDANGQELATLKAVDGGVMMALWDQEQPVVRVFTAEERAKGLPDLLGVSSRRDVDTAESMVIDLISDRANYSR
jgi:hypothetical protein